MRHNGVVVLATPELAAALRDALVRNPVASLGWNGPTKIEVAHDPDKGFKQLREFIAKRS